MQGLVEFTSYIFDRRGNGVSGAPLERASRGRVKNDLEAHVGHLGLARMHAVVHNVLARPW